MDYSSSNIVTFTETWLNHAISNTEISPLLARTSTGLTAIVEEEAASSSALVKTSLDYSLGDLYSHRAQLSCIRHMLLEQCKERTKAACHQSETRDVVGCSLPIFQIRVGVDVAR